MDSQCAIRILQAGSATGLRWQKTALHMGYKSEELTELRVIYATFATAEISVAINKRKLALLSESLYSAHSTYSQSAYVGC